MFRFMIRAPNSVIHTQDETSLFTGPLTTGEQQRCSGSRAEYGPQLKTEAAQTTILPLEYTIRPETSVVFTRPVSFCLFQGELMDLLKAPYVS
jgi:hypothetical protein